MLTQDDFLEMCLWCGAPGTYLCDGILGRSAEVSRARDWSDVTFYTCDAPMCALHVRRVGFLRMSRRAKDGTRCQSIDHCPLCFADGRLSRRTHDVMTAAQADELRDHRRRAVDAERRHAAMRADNGKKAET